MDNRKWLKRKYPKSFKEVNEFLDDLHLEEFKKMNYKLGIITRPSWSIDLYPEGTMIMFKRSNPVTDMNYPMHHAIAKCRNDYTPSGYHSISVWGVISKKS